MTCECQALRQELAAAQAKIKELEAQLRINPLTGLSDKLSLDKALEKALSKNNRNAGKTAVFFLDLDEFKKINDTFSHEVGDVCIKTFAQTLSENLRVNDELFHRSGDEFFIIAEVDAYAGAKALKGKLQSAIHKTTVFSGNQKINLKASIGFTLVDDDAKSVQNVLERVNNALKKDKERRRKKGLRQDRAA